ncbi:MAG: DNA-binding protein WhiA [Ruminococcaceae bacterium]|nr:DNA-binding protein WhiA [Oscillospiraceae bacterium]
MSFAQDTKNDLCAIPCRRKCCRKAMLYGILSAANTFRPDRIRLMTENERTSETVMRLLKECSVKGNLYISEKKSGEQRSNSYKITVASLQDCQTVTNAIGLSPDFRCETIDETIFHCQDCFRHFVRGLYLSAGTIKDPKSGYQLELVFNNQSLSESIASLFEAQGIALKSVARQYSYVLYAKESETIEDFLTFIGAQQSALAIMDVKIYREIRNQANRQNNCETANMFKMTSSAQNQIRAIRWFIDADLFDTLDEDLQVTALLRLENPDASVQEIADMHTKSVSKSGVYHRLQKIVTLSQKKQKE